jgi:glycerol-3-phosphate acyltransferase PlsY
MTTDTPPPDHKPPLVERPTRPTWPFVVALGALVLLASAATVAFVLRRPQSLPHLDAAGYRLNPRPRVGTGHQRADRLAFSRDGRTLAVNSPRYNRTVLFAVEPDAPPSDPGLRLVRDIELPGRPIDVAFGFDRFFILQRPAGDARHLMPAFWQAYDPTGNLVGSHFDVGYDPDALVLLPERKLALVLLSGHAEGETNRPPPSLALLSMADPDHPQLAASFTFDQPADDPHALAVRPANPESPSLAGDLLIAVGLCGSGRIAWLALPPGDPQLLPLGSTPFSGQGGPGPLAFAPDGSLLAADIDAGALWRVSSDGKSPPTRLGVQRDVADLLPLDPRRGLLLAAAPTRSSLELLGPDGSLLGLLPLRGPWGLGTIEPVGLDRSPVANLLAVCDRSGGLHLVAVTPPSDSPARPD